MAEKLQLLAEHQAIGRQVVDHQDPSRRAAGQPWRGVLRRRFGGHGFEGKFDTDFGAFAQHAAQGNAAAHQLDQLPADAQAQARATIFGAGACLSKRLE
ncbi:hypothetical protein D3C75_1058310 [compost metagenome]